MKKAVKKALGKYFSGRNTKSDVGIGVSEAVPRFVLGVTLVYRAGRRYCCTSPACLFHPDWTQLRESFADQGVTPTHPIRIYLSVRYERGAKIGQTPNETSVEAEWTDTAVIDEIEGWNPVSYSCV